MGVELGKEKVIYIHLTLVPFIAASSEIKTKPTQHSVKELRSIGIQPDILVCRSELPLPDEHKTKIALFTNVEERAVISTMDVDDLYSIPLMLHEQGLDQIVSDKLKLECEEADLSQWRHVVQSRKETKNEISIGMVGKYMDLKDAYISLTEALLHAGIHSSTKINIIYIDSERIQKEGDGLLSDLDAILVPGGFGDRGIEGKIDAVSYARKNNVPYLGICLGMQVAIIEFSRNIANLKGAHSTEFDRRTKNPVIALIEEWKDISGKKEIRDDKSNLGGTMRLGAQLCSLSKNSLAHLAYNKNKILERHRHRYEFNNNYFDKLENLGLSFSGISDDGLVEIIEISDHPWFLACQFHPEFTSNPRDGHPLFISFVEAAVKRSNK